MARNTEVKIYTQEEKDKIERMYNDNIPFVLILHEIGGSSKQLKRYIQENDSLAKYRKNFKWTDEIFKKIMTTVAPEIEILGEYTRQDQKIHCRCKIDGYEWDPLIGNLLRGDKCPVCGNQVIVAGINDIWTVNPELGAMLDDPEDGYKYGEYTNKRLKLHCPNCGAKKIVAANNITSKGFICPSCGDGISYPEKFMRNLFDQIEIDYDFQYNPDWIKPRRYDFYIPKHNIVIEVNGLQHYEDTFLNFANSKSAKEQQINDLEKADLALKNGISKVIFVDCSFSRLDYMQESICKNEELKEYFDFSNIDWIDIESKSRKSIVFDVCEFYNNMDDVIGKSSRYICQYIGKEFHLCSDTIEKYLRIGSDIHICNFADNQNNELKKITSSRKIYEVDKDKNIIKIWPSVKSLISYYNSHSIEIVIKKELFEEHLYNGSYWFYEEDYKSMI